MLSFYYYRLNETKSKVFLYPKGLNMRNLRVYPDFLQLKTKLLYPLGCNKSQIS